MKILIVDDDFFSRSLIQRILAPYGETDVAVNGKEAIDAFRFSSERGRPYDLICLDVMMPDMDGQTALKNIRDIEESKGIFGKEGVKIIMATAYSDSKNVMEAFRSQCDAYLVKPFKKVDLIEKIRSLGLLDEKIPEQGQ